MLVESGDSIFRVISSHKGVFVFKGENMDIERLKSAGFTPDGTANGKDFYTISQDNGYSELVLDVVVSEPSVNIYLYGKNFCRNLGALSTDDVLTLARLLGLSQEVA